MVFLKVVFQNKTIKRFQSEMSEKKMIWMYVISFLPYSLLWVQITQEIKTNLILVLPPNKILLHSEKISHRFPMSFVFGINAFFKTASATFILIYYLH